jgi:DNA-binding MarR family transcriptional regulator
MAVSPETQAVEAVETESPQCLLGNLGWLLSRAHWALTSELNAAFEQLGISSRGYWVLAAAAAEERTQGELAEVVGLDKTTMVVTVDELEHAGLAERRRSKVDRRARVIAVTKAGRRKIVEGRKVVERVQSDVLSTLPVPQQLSFVEALASLVDGRLSEPVECNPPLRRR